MAERRMFAKSVINSARFLRMPSTSRLLYYDLGMQADDDGIVEAFTVIRTTGASEDDLRVLATKGFITVLNEDLVSFINDWNINNFIRKDRYSPSVHKELLIRLTNGNQLTTKCQTDVNPNGNQNYDSDIPIDNQPTTSGIPTVNAGKVRLGKDSIGEGRLVKDSQEQDSGVQERGGMEGRTASIHELPEKGTNASYYRLTFHHNPTSDLANALDNWGIDKESVHSIINNATFQDEPDVFIWRQLENKHKR
ncbi:MAG: hypothetical protein PUE91_09990 [Clostridiales bacterium]|nr:hypothetical protein [Clostridiales bacterium]